MARNTPKNTEKESKETSSPARQTGKTRYTGRFAGIRNFMADTRVRRITGIFLGLFSIFLFLACFSYLFSGKADQQLLNAPAAGDGTNPSYANWMGKTGAYLAHFFMYRFFGVGALLLAFVTFLYGVRIAFNRSLLPLWKSTRLAVLGMLYFPVLIAFIFHHRVPEMERQIELTCNDRFVGGFGIVATEWLTFTLGWFGSLLLLLFVAAAYVIFNFSHQVESLWARTGELVKKSSEALAPDDNEPAEVELPLKKKADEADVAPPLNTWKDEFPEPEPQVVEFDDEVPVTEESEEVEEETLTEPITASVVTLPPTTGPDALKFKLEDIEGMEVAAPATEEELTESEIEKKLKEFGEYDPKLDLSRYEFPPIDLLKNHGSGIPQINKEELEENKNRIVETLNHYKIEISKIKATIGPTVTLYEIIPAPGVRISKIKNLEDDIALNLAALGIRIIAPIPGKGTIGIEVPNSKPDVVSMRSLIASDKFLNADMELPIVLGKTISNETFVTDLARMPHLLMAGATGQGKSVGLNAILVSLLYKKHPSQIKFVLVDPKKVELTLFNKIERHFLAKLPDAEDAIITDTQKVVKTLTSLCVEMDHRYELLKAAGCRNIKEYNGKFISRRLNPEKGHRYLPYIVLVVDEFADLIMTAGREVETPIARLAQLARAIGIHLIIATQRPSVNIITGVIKANFPARIAFRVTSKIDSRTILDSGGAEQLIGRGDMLLSTGNDLIRIQCGFVDTPEVEQITDYIGAQQAYPSALLLPEVVDENSGDLGSFDASERDELFEEAARIVVLSQQGSASLLQRKLKLGYNRAGRLVDQLEAAGVIGPFEGSKARKVLLPDEMALEQFLKNAQANTI